MKSFRPFESILQQENTDEHHKLLPSKQQYKSVASLWNSNRNIRCSGTRMLSWYVNCFLKIVTIFNRFLSSCWMLSKSPEGEAARMNLSLPLFILAHVLAELDHTLLGHHPAKYEWCLKQNLPGIYGPTGFVTTGVLRIWKWVSIPSHRDAILHYQQKKFDICHTARNQLNKGLTYGCFRGWWSYCKFQRSYSQQ